MRLPPPPRSLVPLAVLPLLLVISPAAASSFATDGTFAFDPDAMFVEGFEAAPGDQDASPPASSIVEDAGALEGTHVLSANSQYETVNVLVAFPPVRAVYRATAWLRSDATVGVIVQHADGAPGDFSQMFPTGRMTSDGWMEMESAPFSVDGTRGASGAVFFFGDVLADAIEIKRTDAAAFMPPQQCDGLVDPSCDADRLCLGGWCLNPAGWVPPMPAHDDSRSALIAYLEHRLRFFFGPYHNRKHYLPAAVAEMEGMRMASSSWRFWASFATAVRRLRDSHTTTFTLASYIISNKRPMNACFVLGDADLSHDMAPADPDLGDVLVSHAGSSHTWGLAAGDRLVAIDGEHPIAWMRKLITHDFGANPANDAASLSWMTQRMRASIPRYARDITVVRCSSGACGQPEIIEVASIPEVPDPDSINAVSCDGRPQPLVAGQPAHDIGVSAYHGRVIGTEPDEKIYGLVWDYLITGTPGESQVADAVEQWRADGRGVILDHRQGFGGSGELGTTSIADPILAFVRPPTLFGVMPWRHTADEEGPATLDEGLLLVDKYKNTAMRWRGGSNNAMTDVPVALLITRDVSFSDLFPYAFRGSPKVRIFGPNPTDGAFSSLSGLSYWRGFNYQMASGDTIGADGQALCGHGVTPDEVVLPLQSDLVVGRDTLVERALTWVRGEAMP